MPERDLSRHDAEREANQLAERSVRVPPPRQRTPLRAVQGPVADGSSLPFLVGAALRDPGRGLDSDTRNYLEPRFGFDFSTVRLHSGLLARHATRMMNTVAFAVGRDIVLGRPVEGVARLRGSSILAHELAHVALHGRQSPRGVHCYEGPEHQDLGDKSADELFQFLGTKEGKSWAAAHRMDAADLLRQRAQDPVGSSGTIRLRKGLRLTPGQIISLMGDFYGSWDQLKGAPAKELKRILAVMEKERHGTAGDANAEYETITGGRYTELARKNATHFAPANRAAWRALHVAAIEKARESAGGPSDESHPDYQEALGMDAAAGHFLTDAFASGHLIDSEKVLARIQWHLRSNPNPTTTENPEMRSVQAALGFAGLSPSLALKNIHDRLNAEGFDVVNARGMRWKTFGDKNLEKSPETQRVAAYAVFLSRQQIGRARNGEIPDPGEVLALLPDEATIELATQRAIAYIPDALKQIPGLVHRNLGMLDTARLPWYEGGPVLPFIAKQWLGEIADPGRSKVLEDYERRTQSDPSTPYPTPSLLRLNF